LIQLDCVGIILQNCCCRYSTEKGWFVEKVERQEGRQRINLKESLLFFDLLVQIRFRSY
jgi:hypothetical protein